MRAAGVRSPLNPGCTTSSRRRRRPRGPQRRRLPVRNYFFGVSPLPPAPPVPPPPPPPAAPASSFLWHFTQPSGALTLNALLPSWQVPQNLPSFIAAMVILSPPFFISNSLGLLWQSAHFKPLSACALPSNVTLPMGLANSSVLPGGTAMTFPIDS